MVSSAATTITAYLAALPAERRAVVSSVRDVVNASLPGGYEEGMLFGMPSWYIPLSRYPATYNKQPLAYVALAAQKTGYSLYLMGVDADGEQASRLQAAALAQGSSLDMGKSCVRFKRVEDLPLAAIAELVASLPVDAYIEQHEAARKATKVGR